MHPLVEQVSYIVKVKIERHFSLFKIWSIITHNNIIPTNKPVLFGSTLKNVGPTK
jgi:hypothetical protein